ncbi:hypothetical protein APR50_23220 [Variovorax paradoxus]|nr:hypothetical protein APR52_14090 [Variovorax paradoxus]KPV04068.1 hypothetical protein APR50_23220 [Variovorax paradoxus]KPV08095.1 hypothetical protein APR49_16160 [Variovorax paradoxus]KPV22559.1 hypothetical protein APR51_10155 [Variovorax paradoxus]KPV35371.1 hypothetical protein APR48_04295 [Variovorax paradoxus]
MLVSDPELKSRLTAQMAWEAACERVRKVLQPPPGYPKPTAEELEAAFTNAAERLHTLRIMCTTAEE